MIVFFHKQFSKQYRRLDRKLQGNVDMKMALFRENPADPQLHNHALSGAYRTYRSINITGDYRALYKQVNEHVAEFRIIDTHSNLYS